MRIYALYEWVENVLGKVAFHGVVSEMRMRVLFGAFEYFDNIFPEGFIAVVYRKCKGGVVEGAAGTSGSIEIDTVLEGSAINAARLRVVGLVVELTVHGEGYFAVFRL